MSGVGGKALRILTLAACLVLANDLCGRLPFQADLTKERFFSLSPASHRLLDGLETPVGVELYFSGSRKSLPIGLKVFAQRVEQLLRQYERNAGGRLSVRVVDPVPGSAEEDEARRLGLAAQPLGPDERLYFGLAVFHGGNRRTIPLVDYRRERLLEYDISRLIQAVRTHRLPKLAVASSLEVFGKRGMPKELQKAEDGSAEWEFVKELRLSYDLEEVPPNRDTLPAGTDELLVINPSGFDPRLSHAIDQFVLSGRPTVVLFDPFCYQEVTRDDADGPLVGEQYHKASHWPGLLEAWGLRVPADQVIGDLEYATEVPVAENAPPLPFPLWPSIAGFDDTQPVTAGFDAVMLAHAGAIEPLPGSNAQVTPLLQSSRHSGLLPLSVATRTPPDALLESLQPTGQEYTLAAVLEGRFATAFPAGKPAPPEGEGETGETDPWDLHLKRSSAASRLILVADSDFVADAMAYQAARRAGGAVVTRPRNNNVAFLMNGLDDLRGDRELLPVRAKGQTLRPFTRIHALRREADERFRREVQDLNSRLGVLEGELVELNRQAASGGASIVSEQALTAIRRAQKEQNGLKARRLEIQQRLQGEIQDLEQRLTALTLGVVPVLVALAGLVFWWHRTRRTVEP